MKFIVLVFTVLTMGTLTNAQTTFEISDPCLAAGAKAIMAEVHRTIRTVNTVGFDYNDEGSDKGPWVSGTIGTTVDDIEDGEPCRVFYSVEMGGKAGETCTVESPVKRLPGCQ